MEDPLIKNCEVEGTPAEGDGDGDEDLQIEEKEISLQDKKVASPSPTPTKVKVQENVNHPLAGGAVNCLLAVDSVVRATADMTPRKFSFAPPPPTIITTDTAWDSDESDTLLEPLQHTRQLFVREYKKPLKWPIRANRKFQVLNSNGDCIYYAAEESSFLSNMVFFRGILPFKINIMSVNGEPVMEIQGRPLFKNCITIKDSRDQLIGKIKKVHSWCTQSYTIKTWDGTEILNIKGPDGSNCCCLFTDCGNADFDVNIGVGTTSIGKISKEWEYALEDMCGMFVPMKLDELTMSLLLGAIFLIDFNFYQKKRDASCFGRCFMTFLFFTLFVLLLFLIAKK